MKKTFKTFMMLTVIPYLIYFIINIIRFTGRLTYIGTDRIKEFHANGTEIIMSFWHGRLLMIPIVYQGKNLNPLISMHEDGEMIKRTMDLFKFTSIRGSTSRGATKALREMVKRLRSGGDIAITPDGPKGPRHKAQNGAVFLAKMTGAPICPVTFSATGKKQFSSWDRFMLPYPFSKVVIMWGEPIYVSSDADKDEIENKRKELEDELKRITKKADSFF